MCGLFGYSGRSSATPNTIKLLWIYSSFRGTDGTGIYRKGKITKQAYSYSGNISGSSVDASFKTIFTPTVDNHTILGHCRARSVGAVSHGNTHPFEYDINDQRWIFAHNGTIKNIEELATKYGITRVVGDTDSQTLGNILALGHFDVLLEYKGAAAFSLYNETENVLYLWSGSSLHEYSLREAGQERPLAIYKGKDRIYWASDPYNLSTALNTKNNITMLATNTLYKIVDGKIVDKTSYDRSAVDSYTYTPSATTSDKTTTPTHHMSRRERRKLNKSVILLNEPKIQPTGKKTIYCWQGLYYRNGHLLNNDVLMLNSTGSYEQEDSTTEYYFYQGYMLKNKQVYEEVIKDDSKFNKAKIDGFLFSGIYLSSVTIYILRINGRSYVYNRGKYCFDGRIVPAFGFYFLNLNSDGEVESYTSYDENLSNTYKTRVPSSQPKQTIQTIDNTWKRIFEPA